MRTRAGLGVVLHAEGRNVAAGDAFDDAVVQVDVGDVDGVKGALVHGIVMVLAGDLDLAGGQPADRMVAAVMAERQLVGLTPEGGGHQLVPEADTEDRDPASSSPIESDA